MDTVLDNLKKILVVLCPGLISISSIQAQNLNFVNNEFKTFLITHICVDTNGDENPEFDVDLNDDLEIQLSEALLVQGLVITSDINEMLTDVQDLNLFTQLQRLSIVSMNGLANFIGVDLPSLQFIRISDSGIIQVVDLSGCPNLTEIYLESLPNGNSLNLQNGSVATDYFSLFYSNFQYICVDPIQQEIDDVISYVGTSSTISTNCSLDLNEPSIKDLHVYPNPCSDVLTVSKHLKKLEIFNVNGMLVMIIENPTTQIDLSHLEFGVYFLQLHFNDGRGEIQKIVKN